LEIAAEYNCDLFADSTITRLVEHWKLLLETAAADPGCSLSRLPQPARKTSAQPGDAILDNPASDSSLAARHGDCEQRLVSIWTRLLELKNIGVEDDFFDLGGTSLLAIRLFSEIEHTFGKRLDYAVFFQSPTIASLAKNLQGVPQDGATPLVVLQPDGNGSPLFICYSVDGELMYWQDLLRNLGRDHPVYGFQPREVEGAPWPYESVEEVAADCVAQLQTYYPVGPCCLAGFSFGGKVAYEIAQQLRRAGRDVALLAIVDTPPAWETPQSLRGVLRAAPACLWNFPRWFLGMTRNWREFPLRRKIRQRMHRMRDFLNARLGLKRRAPPIPTHEDFFEVRESTDRGRQLIPRLFSAFLKYQPTPYAGRLSLFRARTRPLIHVPRHDLGWGEYAAAVDVEVIPGSHSTILKEPHVRSLAIALIRKLSNVPMVRKPD
jgi:aspartate racemase